MLFMAFGKSALVLNYQINKKVIAATRCENRDKPEMRCDGKCYLSKQLKQAEEKENPVPNFNQLKELSPFITTEIEFSVSDNELITLFDLPFYQVNSPVEACPGSVFQPPEA